MASNSCSRKRQQRSKAALHHKVSQQEKQRIRGETGQQVRQQLNENPNSKHSCDYHNIQQHQSQTLQTQQQQKQQQQQQQRKQQPQQVQQQKQPQTSNILTKSTTRATGTAAAENSGIQSLMSMTLDMGQNEHEQCNASVAQHESNTSLHTAVFWCRHDLVETLLKKGAKPWETDQQGNTAFMAACRVGEIKLMSTLSESAGSNLDVKHANKEGNTALHICAITGNEEGCRFLLSRKACVNAKNKLGETPLHLAAKGDHVGVCHTLLNRLMISESDTSKIICNYILEETNKGHSAMCVSIIHQRAQITRMFLDFLTPQQQANYLTTKIRKIVNKSQTVGYGNSESMDHGCQETFLHGLLVSMSVLLIRMAERRRLEKSQIDHGHQASNEATLDHCLTNTDIIRSFVRIACNRYENQQITPIACFLLIYLMEGIPERAVIYGTDDKISSKSYLDNEATSESNKTSQSGNAFLGQFIQCHGPDSLLLKINETEVTDPNTATITMSTAAPIVSLVRSMAGRSWLESNKCHLTFLKELLLRNRHTLALLASTCPLLHQSFLECMCEDFVRLVEILEARDREQNLAELLLEEERDWVKRERKRQKRQQKKQQGSKEPKKDMSLLSMQMLDVSSEEESSVPLIDSMSTNGDDPENKLWTHTALETEDDVFSDSCDHAKKYHTRDRQKIPCLLSIDAITLAESGDKAKRSQSEHKFNATANDFPPIPSDLVSESTQNVNEEMKEGKGEAQLKESLVCNRCPVVMPGVKRWADVAKLGCNTLDKGLQSQENIDNQAKVPSDKMIQSDWTVDSRLKHAEACKDGNDTTMYAPEQKPHDLAVDTECYQVIGSCSAMDINSDEDSSSSSSSSFESRSSLVSDSCLHIRKQNWMSEKVRVNVHLGDDNTVCKNKSMELKDYPSSGNGAKKRRRTKKSHSCKQVKTSAHHSSECCWDLPFHVVREQSDPTKTSLKVSDFCINTPLTRTQSNDNMLNDSSFIIDMKKLMTSTTNKSLKTDIVSKVSTKQNSQWNEANICPVRPEAPATLPPLKVRDFDINRMGTFDTLFTDTGIGETRMDAKGERTKLVPNTASTKQPSRGRNIPLARIKSGAASHNTQSSHASNQTYIHDIQNVPDTKSVIIPWSDLSTLVAPSSTLSQRPLSISSLPGNDVVYTHTPPPGFQILKSSVSEQPMTNEHICGKDVVFNHKNPDARQKTKGTSTKPRVIATVLLDKVKNPPISFQQTKIPSLSTLPWTCKDEPTQIWNKPFHSYSNIVSSLSCAEPDLGAICCTQRASGRSDVPLSESNCEFTIPLFSQEHCKTGDYDAVKPNEISLPMSCDTTNTVCSSFSTILMNRMQQRRNIRHSTGSTNITKEITSSGISSQSVPHTHKLDVCSTGNTLCQSKASVTTNIDTTTVLSAKTQPQYSLKYRDNPPTFPHQFSSTSAAINKGTEKTDTIEMILVNDSQVVSLERGNVKTKGRGTVSNSVSHEKQGRQTTMSDSQSSSPLVFLPEKIRDDTSTNAERGATFPAFHDVHTSDFLSEMFSDPLFSDKIAINQIKQKLVISSQANQNIQSDFSLPTWEGGEIDLDYYASLYQMKFRDVLGCLPGQNPASLKSDRDAALSGNGSQKSNTSAAPLKDGQGWHTSQAFGVSSSTTGHRGDVASHLRTHSTRWHTSLQKMLDLPWTMRRQYGNIILPHSVQDFSIGMAGNVLLLLGFLMDGSEVTVLVMDKARSHVIPRVIEIMSDSEMDKHFLIRCKSFSQSLNIQYMAIPLYEFTLCEYIQMYLPTGSHQSLTVSKGLIRELLQALNFLHHGLNMSHGCLAPCWVFIDSDGHLRLAGFGIAMSSENMHKNEANAAMDFQGCDYQSSSLPQTENVNLNNERLKPSFYNDIQAAGMLAYFILTRGQYLFGVASMETELSIMRDRVGMEAFDLISPMIASDPQARPTIDQCLKHPMFWSRDKKFRLILIVGSDVLTEMKTGVALTGNGAPTMMEILSLVDINAVSPNWIHEVDSTVLKEMRSFRVYKNNLAELTLFVYNCCLHFDKLSNVAKEVLDDPCKYFQNLFPRLFIAIYRSLKASDRTDRTCYKPFF